MVEAFECGVRNAECGMRWAGLDSLARGIELQREGWRPRWEGGGFWLVRAVFNLRLNKPKQGKTNQNKSEKILRGGKLVRAFSGESGHAGSPPYSGPISENSGDFGTFFWRGFGVFFSGGRRTRWVVPRRGRHAGLRRFTVNNGELRWITLLFFIFLWETDYRILSRIDHEMSETHEKGKDLRAYPARITTGGVPGRPGPRKRGLRACSNTAFIGRGT